ncbi:hypothetical protein [Microbulbifer zhoushanensis]|uniref:hypothetical protein n=1 Tax=Microbulbifer zhoushanensis TaxID=2904254 RepID=UPI001F34B395|nr:hypothetical protein [Microbulbifer zhoushanensis]
MRSLGIVSPNFGGSTVFGHLLGGYEGLSHVGEIHKVYSGREGECRECGSSCPLFTAENIAKIQNVKRPIYNKCADILGLDVLVTGDKNPYFYDKTTGLPDALVVLLKDPMAHTYSFYTRSLKQSFHSYSNEFRWLKFRESALTYYTTLVDRVAWAAEVSQRHGIPVKVVSLEEFIDLDDEGKSGLAQSWLNGRKYDSSRLKAGSHYIAGNHKISNGGNARGIKFFKGMFKRDDRYSSEFGQAHVDELNYSLNEFSELRGYVSRLDVLTPVSWLGV